MSDSACDDSVPRACQPRARSAGGSVRAPPRPRTNTTARPAPKAISRATLLMGAGGLVARLVDRRQDLLVLNRGIAGDYQPACGGADLHVLYAGELADLLRDSPLAVRAGHPGHLVFGRCHVVSLSSYPRGDRKSVV